MNKILVFLLFSIQFYALSQTESSMADYERDLALLLNELRSAKNDEEKQIKNDLFKLKIAEVLKQKEAFSYPFSQLKSVGFVDSPDGTLRIVNWNVEQDDETQRYYCYLLHVDQKKKEVLVSELTENLNQELKPLEILEADQWYGALYYKIIPIDKGSKKLYTLLGWDGNNSMSSIKLIDVLYFSGDHPKLGSPIFKSKDVVQKRIFFEHSKKTVMSLKYEPQYQRIIYDHLSPETPELKGFYSFYVPDFSYDAFYLTGAKWMLHEDVIGVNQVDNEKVEVYVKNEKTGKIEKKEIKNKWQNPSDENVPGGGSQHVSVTPEEGDLKNDKDAPPVDKHLKSNDKRDPSKLNTTTGGSKRKKKKHK